MAMAGLAILTSVIAVLMMSCAEAQGGGLQKDFYSSTCPKAEKIVRSVVEKYFANDSTIAPGLLRLHFHDCFVQGCDGSVLISGSSAERTAVANLGLRGFEVVDDAKSQLEATCPGIVSCADTLALAARDAVDLSDGPRWTVALGRRDGRVSSASDVANLPSPFDSVTVQRKKFADKGMSDQDLVTLVGGHTIGKTDCAFFRYRLYNFTATGNADPSISQASLAKFRELCPEDGDPSVRVALDQGSAGKFDASFFRNVKEGNGVLESDQRLWEDEATKDTVAKYAGNLRGILGLRFDYEFGKAMNKLGAVGVKTGTDGEIRKTCSLFN